MKYNKSYCKHEYWETIGILGSHGISPQLESNKTVSGKGQIRFLVSSLRKVKKTKRKGKSHIKENKKMSERTV